MGSTVFVGVNTDAKSKVVQSLSITLGGTDSSLFDVLIDNALGPHLSDILEKIREVDVLAQLHFSELSSEEFKAAIVAIHDYLDVVDDRSDWHHDAKELWWREFEPLILKDDRYNACKLG